MEIESSPVNVWRILKSTAKLGVGEAIARLASFVLFAYITRAYGVGLLGIVAIAQTVATYVTMGTDQGLILIGARIVARSRSAVRPMIKPVLRKRLVLCALSVSIGSAYALWGPVPSEARFYVLGFALAVIPYAFSLDWIAWGLDHMGSLGGWRAFVNVCFVAGAVLAMHWTGATLLPLVVSKIASAAAGTLLLWGLWHFAWRHELGETTADQAGDPTAQLLWGAIFALGAATIFNLLFNNVDTLILAGMTNSAEVGRYNAAYKILFLIFSGYYLITQSLYPHFAMLSNPTNLRKWLLRALLIVGLAGSVLAGIIWLFSEQILTLIYGSSLGSVLLLHILAVSLPLDFCTSLMGILLVSRGRDKLLLLITGSAAALNIGLNFLLIPSMQARGAAWATILSYAFLLTVMLGAICRPAVLATP